MLTLENLSLSIHYLIKVKFSGEIWTKSYCPKYTKFCAFWQKKKMVDIFWQSVDAILEDVSVTETIVWCLNINSKIIIF